MISRCFTLHLSPNPHNSLSSSILPKPKPNYPLTTSLTPTPLSTKIILTHKRCHKFHHMASNQSKISPEFDESSPDPTLTNDDLKPTKPADRTFSGWEMASLWVGLVVGVPTYYLAGSLVDLGMSWWQGIATVVAANIILLIPLVLTGHPGTRYGVPGPGTVLFRDPRGPRPNAPESVGGLRVVRDRNVDRRRGDFPPLAQFHQGINNSLSKSPLAWYFPT